MSDEPTPTEEVIEDTAAPEAPEAPEARAGLHRRRYQGEDGLDVVVVEADAHAEEEISVGVVDAIVDPGSHVDVLDELPGGHGAHSGPLGAAEVKEVEAHGQGVAPEVEVHAHAPGGLREAVAQGEPIPPFAKLGGELDPRRVGDRFI